MFALLNALAALAKRWDNWIAHHLPGQTWMDALHPSRLTPDMVVAALPADDWIPLDDVHRRVTEQHRDFQPHEVTPGKIADVISYLNERRQIRIRAGHPTHGGRGPFVGRGELES